MIPEREWIWTGWAAHLIVGEDCRFHLCTDIGDYRVSTVGAYLPDAGVREILAESRGITLEGRGDARRASWRRQVGWEDVGHRRKFETMVFRLAATSCDMPDCGCGLRDVADWSELAVDGYNDPGEAHRGHLAMCRRVAAGEVPVPEDIPL
jgi:hypothetical protein